MEVNLLACLTSLDSVDMRIFSKDSLNDGCELFSPDFNPSNRIIFPMK